MNYELIEHLCFLTHPVGENILINIKGVTCLLGRGGITKVKMTEEDLEMNVGY